MSHQLDKHRLQVCLSPAPDPFTACVLLTITPLSSATSQPVGIYVGDRIEVPINDKVYPGVVVYTRNFIHVEFKKSTRVPNGKGIRKGFLQRTWLPRVLSKMMCRDCSRHGVCLGYKCECRDGWGGKFCDKPRECPNRCSGL